jgi:hypothetical protein
MISPGQTLYADPAQMRAWIDRAAPGHAMVYAAGPGLDGGRHPAAVLARGWQSEGLASLHGPNSEKFGQGRFVAVKRKADGGAPDPAGQAAAGARHGSRGALDARSRAVLAVLIGAALRGEACPGYRRLAREAGLRDAQAARYRLKKLVRAGLVTVEDMDGQRFARVIFSAGETG